VTNDCQVVGGMGCALGLQSPTNRQDTTGRSDASCRSSIARSQPSVRWRRSQQQIDCILFTPTLLPPIVPHAVHFSSDFRWDGRPELRVPGPLLQSSRSVLGEVLSFSQLFHLFALAPSCTRALRFLGWQDTHSMRHKGRRRAHSVRSRKSN